MYFKDQDYYAYICNKFYNVNGYTLTTTITVTNRNLKTPVSSRVLSCSYQYIPKQKVLSSKISSVISNNVDKEFDRRTELQKEDT